MGKGFYVGHKKKRSSGDQTPETVKERMKGAIEILDGKRAGEEEDSKSVNGRASTPNSAAESNDTIVPRTLPMTDRGRILTLSRHRGVGPHILGLDVGARYSAVPEAQRLDGGEFMISACPAGVRMSAVPVGQQALGGAGFSPLNL